MNKYGFFSSLFLLVTLPVFAQDSAPHDLMERFGLREARQAVSERENWKPPHKVVVWGNNSRMQVLKDAHPDLQFNNVSSTSELPQSLTDADVFIGRCISSGIDSGHKLRWLMSLSVGVENCAASDYLKNQNTLITNVQKLSGPEIAEHAIALMMALNRGLDAFVAAQQSSTWDRGLLPGDETIWELEGRTVLVVGLGGIGKEVARRAYGLGMKVIATRNSRREGPAYVSYVGLADELLTLAKQADVVINTAPLTEKTQGMYNAEFFKAMQNHAYFISVGRGRSTNTDDLLAALKSGELAGAGLDVTDPEPLPADHPLWQQPRVIITPHMAARSEKVRDRIWTLVGENLRRYIAGEKMISEVNLDRGY